MQKLIKINTEHYIIVDESKQPVEGYYYDSFINKIKNTNGAEYGEAKHCWQITYSTQPLEEGTTIHGIEHKRWVYIKYIDLSEVKELLGEVDVEKKADEEYYEQDKSFENDIDPFFNYSEYLKVGFIDGYNQALENNKEKKYTEEDINKIRQILVEGAITNMSCSSAVVELDKYIQSLKPKTEWEVEIVDGKLKLK